MSGCRLPSHLLYTAHSVVEAASRIAETGGPAIHAALLASQLYEALKLELAKLSAPLPYGGPLVLSGGVNGATGGNRRVQLQESPFPYLTPFVSLGLIQTTSVTGRFAPRCERRIPSLAPGG